MPAGLILLESLALALTVRAVDFARRREDQERVAVEVHVGVRLKLRFGFGDSDLPPAIA